MQRAGKQMSIPHEMDDAIRTMPLTKKQKSNDCTNVVLENIGFTPISSLGQIESLQTVSWHEQFQRGRLFPSDREGKEPYNLRNLIGDELPLEICTPITSSIQAFSMVGATKSPY
jgi:hypothetical protein